MEKKHSNPYLEHIGSQQKLFEPMIPTRPIRDVNNHSKVIYIDETRERIPDPPNPRNLLIPMDFHEPDAIDMSNKEILKMKGLVSEPAMYRNTSIPTSTPVYRQIQVPSKDEQPTVQELLPKVKVSKATDAESAPSTSEDKMSPYDTAQYLLTRFHMKSISNVLHIFDGQCYRPYPTDTALRFIVDKCRSQAKAAGTPSFPKSVYDCLRNEPRIECKVGENSTERYRFVTFENGTLDLKTGQLHPHSPQYFTTYCLKCQYNPSFANLSTPYFDTFLHQMSGGDRLLEARVLEFIGYCLVPDLDGRVIFLLQGYSGAGKSLISNFLHSLYPDEVVSSLNVHELGDKFAVSELSRKVICLSPDLPAGVLDDKSVSALKKLSGHDKVSSDVKFQSRVEFECEATFVLATNHMLCTKRRDEALIDRIVVIPFAFPVAKEARMPSLIDNLKEETDRIANRALQAYFCLRSKHYIFSGNYEINAVTEATSISSDLESCMAAFVQDWIIPDPNGGVHNCEACELFCSIYNLSINDNAFSRLFTRFVSQKHPIEHGRVRLPGGGNPKNYIKGIRLKDGGQVK